MELGRWKGVPYNERLCTFCNNDVGDEYHMMLVCPYFKEDRVKYVRPYYYRNPNTLKFQQLMTSKQKKLPRLCYYIQIINKSVTSIEQINELITVGRRIDQYCFY